jgi:hypothetical protein
VTEVAAVRVAICWCRTWLHARQVWLSRTHASGDAAGQGGRCRAIPRKSNGCRGVTSVSKACACLVERGAVFPRAKFSLKASFRWLPWVRRGSGCGQRIMHSDAGASSMQSCDFEIATLIEMMASLSLFWHSPIEWSRRPVLLDASSGDSSGPGSHRGCAETATHSAANNAQKSAMFCL